MASIVGTVVVQLVHSLSLTGRWGRPVGGSEQTALGDPRAESRSRNAILPSMAESVREVCLRILQEGELDAKLAPPPPELGFEDRSGPVALGAPARAPGLELVAGAGRLPRPAELDSADARARCLARFAHHELMAVELLAWALLRWPDAPEALRRGLVGVLAQEQDHCRRYLERLRRHGSRLEEHPCSDYFWKHADAIAASPHGVRAFLAAMGLTFEQANLDFSLRYRDAFRAVGDEASAEVCQRVHDDEVGHVRLAASWMRRLSPGADAIRAYRTAVPFPLGPARAKGRPFQPQPRYRAGLDPEFVDWVRRSRSPQEAGRGPDL